MEVLPCKSCPLAMSEVTLDRQGLSWTPWTYKAPGLVPLSLCMYVLWHCVKDGELRLRCVSLPLGISATANPPFVSCLLFPTNFVVFFVFRFCSDQQEAKSFASLPQPSFLPFHCSYHWQARLLTWRLVTFEDTLSLSLSFLLNNIISKSRSNTLR
jgi:hypothetical protein